MPSHQERERSREYNDSTPELTDEDQKWLLASNPRLELTDGWYRKTNKHLCMACQPLPRAGVVSSSDLRLNILSMRKNVFRHLGILDEDHLLHEAWCSQFDEEHEEFSDYMSPAFFIENARRLSRTDTDIIAAFRESPILFRAHRNLTQRHNVWKDDAWILSLESPGNYEALTEKGTAERVAEVFGIQHFLGFVATEMPHIVHDSLRKQIAMARIALELYGIQDFSRPENITEFLEWSPEALLLTALNTNEPTLSDVQLKDTLGSDRGYRDSRRKNFARYRRERLIEELLASPNQTVLSSSALRDYFKYLPMNQREREQFEDREYKESLPRLNESHFVWLRRLVGEEVTLDEVWLEYMNQLIETGSSPRRKLTHQRNACRQQFFSVFGLYDGQSCQPLPAPRRLIEFADILHNRQIGNIAEILQCSLRCLSYKPETNEDTLLFIAKKGYDCERPEVQVLLPIIFATRPGDLQEYLRPFEEAKKYGLFDYAKGHQKYLKQGQAQ